eukprot:gene13414-13542_t
MVKAYLRYEHAGAFGVISSNANVVYDASGKQVAFLSPEVASTSSSTKAAAEVTQLALSPNSNQLAAGYADGTVRLWDIPSRSCQVTLSGHSGAVTALQYSSTGALLASGAADTTCIVWDVIGEALIQDGSKLISSSKDGSIKVWDVILQHCCQTLLGFKGEVWSLDVNPDESRLVAGCVDTDLRVYAILNPNDMNQQLDNHIAAIPLAAGAGGGRGGDEGQGPAPEAAMPAEPAGLDASASQQQQQQKLRRHEVLLPMGIVRRAAQERVSLIRFDAAGQLLGVMGAGKSLEIFRVRSEEEAIKKMKRRRKRKKEKSAHKAAKTATQATPGGHHVCEDDDDDEEGGAAGAEGGSPEVLQASDEMGQLLLVTSKHKMKSFSFCPVAVKGCLGQVALGLANNSVEVLDVKEASYETSHKLELCGHRSDIRCLALASDDSQLLSGSNSGCKLWDPVSGASLGSVDSGYALCCVFAPGNRHALLGTKEGWIQLLDVGSCTVIHTEEAHSGPVWSLALLPDKSGFVSGSADKTIKFWTWAVTTTNQQEDAEAAAAAGNKAKKQKKATAEEGRGQGSANVVVVRQLGFKETRGLQMSEDVLCVRVSPDGRLLAASLLDATIKVYYIDSLKFFLSLYGHKLPALTLDISSDSTLLVSGSADKNIKVWGLDFGDCHRSLFAHQDTVTAVTFVRDTHYVFSAGKDRVVKYWDMDRFELLLELPAHLGEVWALALSAYGDFLLSGSHDRSIRRWERTSDEGSAPASRRTIESVSAADSIIDALDVAAHEADKDLEYHAAVVAAEAAAAAAGTQPVLPKQPPSNPLMLGLSADAYVLKSVTAVRANDLEQALLLLPFNDALRLMQRVSGWLKQGSQVELSCRVATLLLRLHHGQMTATPSARQTLVELHTRLRAAVQGLKDTLGFNIAGLKFLQRMAKESKGVEDADVVQAARRQLLQAS